jgi:tRNA U34 5-carboxymethylaminomethyl modifying enzyme MnmG/GidA
MQVPSLGPAVADGKVAEQVEIGVKYAGYLDRQREEIERQQRHEATPIAEAFDYATVRGLSAEALQKLERVRPQTIGQAQRIRHDPGGDLAAAGAPGARAPRPRGVSGTVLLVGADLVGT